MVGNYRVGAVLGRGGVGPVRRGKDSSGRPVALELVSVGGAGPALASVVEAVSRCGAPGLLPVQDVVALPGGLALVTPLV
ncbi:MAG: serine/threonine protein kinase, partial [Acidimicrobiales bacterium]